VLRVARRVAQLLSELLSPGERLLRRWRSAGKFLLVAAVLTAPLAWLTTAYASDKQAQVEFSEAERLGLRVQAEVWGVLIALARPDRDGLGAALDAVDPEDLVRLGLDAEWQALDRSLRDATSPPARTALARPVATFLITVGDVSNLTLDPEVTTYYLMDALQFRLPQLVLLGREALTGADEAAIGARGVEAAERARLLETLGRSIGGLGQSMPGDAVDGVRRAVLADTLPATGGPDALAAHLTSLDRHWNGLRPVLDDLLAQRITELRQERSRVIGIAVAAMALAAYLFLALARSLLRPVGRILDALRAAGRGDLTGAALRPDGVDELATIERQVGETLSRVNDAQHLLAHQATHDSLTGLPNRRLAVRRLGEAIGRARRADGATAGVLFIDLDRFKVINDSLGHDVGDHVLRAVADRLRQALRPIDILARLAGDEFVAICEHLADPDDARRAAEAIVDSLRLPLVVDTTSGPVDLVVGASVGVALVHPGEDADAASLLRDADVAMYTAKQHRRGSIVMFDKGQRDEARRVLDVREALRRAIDRDEVVVHLQPIVPLSHTGRICFEALARWDRPGHGPVTPGEFIPIAEDSGLIVPLGLSVLRQSCRWLAEQQRAGHPVEIAVNLSPRQLAHPTLVHDVGCVVAETGVDPDGLWLEITETALAEDVAQVTAVLHRLRALGVHLAIDDFGTGYSSLGHLSHFPVEQVKIDRSFVAGMLSGGREGDIVAAITRLAHGLGLAVVAEGVETPEQEARLRQLGCDEGQGWLFGRPNSPAYYGDLLVGAPSGTRTHT
jgi:diguanylate cyclase (GGDEF)-like protein